MHCEYCECHSTGKWWGFPRTALHEEKVEMTGIILTVSKDMTWWKMWLTLIQMSEMSVTVVWFHVRRVSSHDFVARYPQRVSKDFNIVLDHQSQSTEATKTVTVLFLYPQTQTFLLPNGQKAWPKPSSTADPVQLCLTFYLTAKYCNKNTCT